MFYIVLFPEFMEPREKFPSPHLPTAGLRAGRFCLVGAKEVVVDGTPVTAPAILIPQNRGTNQHGGCKPGLQATAEQMAKDADVSRQTIQQAKAAHAAGLGDQVRDGVSFKHPLAMEISACAPLFGGARYYDKIRLFCSPVLASGGRKKGISPVSNYHLQWLSLLLGNGQFNPGLVQYPLFKFDVPLAQ